MLAYRDLRANSDSQAVFWIFKSEITGVTTYFMNCKSEGASKNLLIQQKDVVLTIDHIMPGSLYT